MKRLAINLLKTIVAAAIYAAIFWYSFSISDNPDRRTTAMIGLISLGIAYGVWTALFKVAGELAGGIMVLAEFLNRHLLEPQKQRLLEQGRREGRKEGRAEILARMEELGMDPSALLADQEAENEGNDS
ncbi:MAG: hypothetical protein OXL37_11445 [Chloroflexota bacterium]|nr:hypothetical protein [Chloroflexota bacterium]MDE2960500.1 hypothetical protein [Chloroflexota bacterium]